MVDKLVELEDQENLQQDCINIQKRANLEMKKANQVSVYNLELIKQSFLHNYLKTSDTFIITLINEFCDFVGKEWSK